MTTQPGFFKGICRCSLRRERFSAVSILNGIKEAANLLLWRNPRNTTSTVSCGGAFQKAVPLEMANVFFPEIPKEYPMQSLSHRASQREN